MPSAVCNVVLSVAPRGVGGTTLMKVLTKELWAALTSLGEVTMLLTEFAPYLCLRMSSANSAPKVVLEGDASPRVLLHIDVAAARKASACSECEHGIAEKGIKNCMRGESGPREDCLTEGFV